jgi:hypothetical protein
MAVNIAGQARMRRRREFYSGLSSKNLQKRVRLEDVKTEEWRFL